MEWELPVVLLLRPDLEEHPLVPPATCHLDTMAVALEEAQVVQEAMLLEDPLDAVLDWEAVSPLVSEERLLLLLPLPKT